MPKNLYAQQAQQRRWLEAAQGDVTMVEAALVGATRRARAEHRCATAAMVSEELGKVASTAAGSVTG